MSSLARRTTIAVFALCMVPLTSGCPESAKADEPGSLLTHGWGGEDDKSSDNITSRFSSGPDGVTLRFETQIEKSKVGTDHPFEGVKVFLETNAVGARGTGCRALEPARSAHLMTNAVQWHFDVVCAWTEPDTHYAGFVTVRVYEDGSTIGR